MRHLHLPVQLGGLLQFDYPERNLLTLEPTWRSRTIVVESITDTLREPIDPRAVELEPLLRRGRWLVTGWDVDLEAQRSFYLEAMRGVWTPQWLTLGLYDPMADEPGPLRIRGVFAPTVRDRLFLAEVLRRFRRKVAPREDLWMTAGVFPLTAELLSRELCDG